MNRPARVGSHADRARSYARDVRETYTHICVSQTVDTRTHLMYVCRMTTTREPNPDLRTILARMVARMNERTVA